MDSIARDPLMVVACMVVLAATGVQAQSYPTRSVRFVVPYAAGGGTDITARSALPKMTEQMNNQSLVVDNRPGGNAMIGADIVAKAAPDGYTVLVSASSEIVTNQSLFKKMPYDAVRDFAPVTLAVTTPNILVTHPSLPVKNLKQLIALAKARPGALGYASIGIASPQHLAGELLKVTAGIDLLHVPFKGAAPALIDVLGGHVPIGMISLLPTVPHLKAGRLVPIAVTTSKRSAGAPEVPTMSESGMPGFELFQWYAVLVPTGTPREIIDKLNAQFNRAVNLPDVKEKLIQQGADPVGTTPEQFAAFIKSEIEKNARIIRTANVKAE